MKRQVKMSGWSSFRITRTVAAAGLLVAAAVSIAACARAPGPPAARLTRDPDLEAFEIAVRMRHPAAPVVMSLANQYLAAGEDARGQATFCALATAVPDRPLFGALCGLFEARRAPQVPLVHRVAWVERALGDLDRAAAADGLSRYLRGVVTSGLPPRFGRAAQAAEDLEWMLAHASSFPPGLRRGAYAALATAYPTLGRAEAARDARTRAGLGAGGDEVASGDLAGAPRTLVTDFSVDAHAGLRFSTRALLQPAPGVFVARGYDFADLAFVVTDAGVVAIDAGTSPETARAALAAFRAVSAAPLRAVIVTHAHWDHIGGLSAFAGPGVEIIAQAGFATELARANSSATAPRLTSTSTPID
jgi:hypothetical protein